MSGSAGNGSFVVLTLKSLTFYTNPPDFIRFYIKRKPTGLGYSGLLDRVTTGFQNTVLSIFVSDYASNLASLSSFLKQSIFVKQWKIELLPLSL